MGIHFISSRALPFLVALSTSAIAFASVSLLVQSHQERFRLQRRTDIFNQLSTIHARLEGAVNSRLFLTQGLVAYVANNPEISDPQFQKIAKHLLARQVGIQTITLARNTTLMYVYPRVENQKIIGLNPLQIPEQRGAVLRAINTRKTVVSGPVHLVQGGMGVIGRTPIYLPSPDGNPEGGSFWGLASIVILRDPLFQEAGLFDKSAKLQYALCGKDGLGASGEVFFGDKSIFEHDPVIAEVSLPNGSWQLAAIPVGGWGTQVPGSEWLWVTGGLLACLAGALAFMLARDPARLHAAVERAIAALQESETRYKNLMEQASDGIFIADQQGNYLTVNAKACEMLGYTQSELLQLNVKDLIPKKDLEIDPLHFKQLFAGKTIIRERRLCCKDGTIIPVEISAKMLEDGRLQAIVRDITRRKRAEEQLLYNAFHDILTGLPNRALFTKALRQAVEQAKQQKDDLFAVLFLDCDRFKVVNDSLGHTIGDQLLIEIAHKLEECLRPEDMVARLGGDEFIILLNEIQSLEDAICVAERIQNQLTLPFSLKGQEVYTSASIGIVLSDNGYQQSEDILRDADIALYRAKALGKARYQVFEPALRVQAMQLLQLETDLRQAVERQEFQIYYQPIVSLKTGKITGFEALLRWQHPDRGLVLPAEFISIAEETGVIIPLGQWVLNQACRQMQLWQKQFPVAPLGSSSPGSTRPLTLSVNLSSKQLMQPNFVRQIDQILQETGLSAASLKLEITESVMMENTPSTTAILLELQALELQLQIDDFGTGYSSLSYLHRFPINALKIDRSFVNDIGIEGKNSKIVQTIILLARSFGMDVIAEGVETVAQLAQLKALGCEYAQGYLFSPPLTTDAAGVFIAAQPKW
jgi:diguanylate cyclase (GGDEF)-like protein/PAS domain S-box-containing protein